MTYDNTPGAANPDPAMSGADPHEEPWYWRLYHGLFGYGTRPQTDSTEDETDRHPNWYKDLMAFPADRMERYRIFREMDTFDLVQMVFDIYADEVTQIDYDRQAAVWIESPHSHMVEAGKLCLSNIMIEDRVYALARGASLLGDSVRRLVYQTGKGVLGWKYVDPAKWHRLEDKYDRLIGFKEDGKKFRGKRAHPVSWPWDYVHFRLQGKDEDSVYGSSAAVPLYRAWRELTIASDTQLMYQIKHGTDRNVVFVNVGNMEEHEGVEHINRWRKRFRKQEIMDPASPRYKSTYNPLTPGEDIFMPVRGPDDLSRIESLSGGGDLPDIANLMFFLNKFAGVSKVPKSYMGFDGDHDARATIAQQDVRFARSMKRIRKAGIYGIRNTLDIHYTLFDPGDNPDNKDRYDIAKNPYTVHMSPISYLDEWERIELIQMRFTLIESVAGLAQSLGMNAHAWSLYVMLTYAKLPEEIVQRLMAKADASADVPGGNLPFGGNPPAEAVVGNGRSKRSMRDLLQERHGRAEQMKEFSKGFYSLSATEERTIAEAVHSNPKLRKIIGDMAFFFQDDMTTDSQQTDPSMLPPQERNGVRFKWEDSLGNTAEAALLQEHLSSVELLTEG